MSHLIPKVESDFQDWENQAIMLLREVLPNRRYGCLCANCLRDEIFEIRQAKLKAIAEKEQKEQGTTQS